MTVQPPSVGSAALPPPPASIGGGDRLRGMVRGIDVSNHQPEIDWEQARRDGGVQVAYLKATEGKEYVDATYAQKRRDANDAGVVVGAYDFARPGSRSGDVRADARAEAQHFLEHAKVRSGDLAPVLDLEDDGTLTPEQLAVWTETWVDTVRQATGAKPVVYASPGFWNGEVRDDGDIAQKSHLWVAHWGVSNPDVPGQWDDWKVWQRSSQGSVPGISGDVDVNTFQNPGELIVGDEEQVTQRAPSQRQPQPAMGTPTQALPDKPDPMQFDAMGNPIQQAPVQPAPAPAPAPPPQVQTPVQQVAPPDPTSVPPDPAQVYAAGATAAGCQCSCM